MAHRPGARREFLLPEPAPVPAQEIVQQVTSLLRHGEEDNGVAITVGPLPRIIADRKLFRQIMFNLLHNAMRAVENTGTVRIEAVTTGPSRSRFGVSDTGIGVSADIRDQLFRPYASGWWDGLGAFDRSPARHGARLGCGVPFERRLRVDVLGFQYRDGTR